MTTFNEREQAFELGFAHDEEIQFKILAHRNALLGQWAASRLGYTGAIADKYIETITNALCEPATGPLSADEKVILRLVMNLTTAGWETTREDVRKVLSDFEDQARTAVMAGRAA